MKITLILTLIIVLSTLVVGISNKDHYKDNSRICANQFKDNTINYELLYWRENGECCTYKLIDNKVTEWCI